MSTGKSNSSEESLQSPVATEIGDLTSTDNMKRTAARKLIERYYYQLTEGCGNDKCDNEFCASSGQNSNVRPNEAAAQAIQLFTKKVRLCELQPSKILRTNEANTSINSCGVGKSTVGAFQELVEPMDQENIKSTGTDKELTINVDMSPTKSCVLTSNEKNNSIGTGGKVVPYLTESILRTVIDECKLNGSHSLLIRTLGQVFSSPEALNRSFLRTKKPVSTKELMSRSSSDVNMSNMKKEDIRAMEGDPDKDEDSKEVASMDDTSSVPQVSEEFVASDDVNVDFESLKRAYELLFSIDNTVFESALIFALVLFAETAELELKFHKAYENNPNYLNSFVILFEMHALGQAEFLEAVLPPLCRALGCLPIAAQARLVRVWARHCSGRLKSILEMLQQLVTLKVISEQFMPEYAVNDCVPITSATQVMKIAYYANILAGELEPVELRVSSLGNEMQTPDEMDSLDPFMVVGQSKEPKVKTVEPLEEELGFSSLDSRRPIVPFGDFYNEPLNDAIEMHKDFSYYKSPGDSKRFSFMNYAFILTPATKSLGLYYDNRIRMYSERRMSNLHSFVNGQPTNPYLRLKVRRDHLIEDALVELEMVAMENPGDLKKQLVVEFDGEQGIDEGGVSKEFFQLIVEDIFNPDYAMFVFNVETQTFWFNPTSFESDAQFTLVGILLGLAIYNNVILDVHFPMVLYKKLMGKKGSYYDLEDWNPTLFRSLKNMLEYEQDDMEEVFVQTFRISYQDVFGSVYYHELKHDGDQILVCQTNKVEFVDLYAEFLLNKAVDRQFRAFKRGFQMVTDESPLKILFRPEEIEQLVCGSKNFDFNELEEATEYDGGYTPSSTVIKYFWEIVHEMAIEDKRKLLQFSTGSDRIPVGGLSKLRLIIARNGPDTDRFPTAHTCFNVLLLPEYASKEKLRERLLKAINYSKGFGML